MKAGPSHAVHTLKETTTRRSELGVHRVVDEILLEPIASETPQVGSGVRCCKSGGGDVTCFGAWELCGRSGNELSCNGG